MSFANVIVRIGFVYSFLTLVVSFVYIQQCVCGCTRQLCDSHLETDVMHVFNAYFMQFEDNTKRQKVVLRG